MPEVLDREVSLGALDTIEDIAPAVDLGDMHRWRELAAPPFVEVNIAEELGQKGLTLGDDAVISEQIFRIIRGEDLRRGSVAKIQTIPAQYSGYWSSMQRLSLHCPRSRTFK